MPLLAELEDLLILLAHFLAVIVNHKQVLLVGVVDWIDSGGPARLVEELVVDLLGLFEICVRFLYRVDANRVCVLLEKLLDLVLVAVRVLRERLLGVLLSLRLCLSGDVRFQSIDLT